MHEALHPSRLVPAGFVVKGAAYESDRLIITVRHSNEFGICPSCGTVSRRVHSRYQRRANDLPLSAALGDRQTVPLRRSNVPLVFVGVGDPVGDGFVASLAHPGGNITGFAGTEAPMAGKWLEVLKETAPSLTRAMAIVHLETPAHQAMWNAIKDAALRSGIEATAASVHDAAEIESAMASFATKANVGIIVLPHAVTWANGDLIIALGARHRMPAIYATEGSVAAGGLVSYGLDFVHSFRQTAEYVDRVLHGAKPADLPVQQPSKFKLTFNLKAAKGIGITVPPTLLARADEVIE